MSSGADAFVWFLGTIEKGEVADFCRHYDLPVGGTKKDQIVRLRAHLDGRLAALVSEEGPAQVGYWNDEVERLGGPRRKSFGAVVAEIERCYLQEEGSARARAAAGVLPGGFEGLNVADARDDDELLEELADQVGANPATLRRMLSKFHGSMLLEKAWQQMSPKLAVESVPEEKSNGDTSLPVRFHRFNISDVRDDDARLDALASAVRVPPHALLRQLERFHGRTLLVNAWTEILPKLEANRKKQRGPEAPSREPLVSSSPPDAPQPPNGYLVRGRWKIDREIGKGGFGFVYRAIDCDFPSREPRVLKFPRDQSPAVKESIRHEIEKTQSLWHDAICRCEHVDTDPRFGLFLVMPYGGTALTAMCKEAGLEVALATQIMEVAAIALDYVHGRGVVHGDVNPGNILIDERHQVRLTDFGLASALETLPATHGPTRMGTSILGYHREFSAPEVLRQRPPRPASDQWSLAAVLCAALQGYDAFCDEPRYRFDHLSERQNAAIKRALEPDPHDRFPSCGDFMRALK